MVDLNDIKTLYIWNNRAFCIAHYLDIFVAFSHMTVRDIILISGACELWRTNAVIA